MKNEDIELIFAKKIMSLMEEALEIVQFYNSKEYNSRKYQIIKELASLTGEILRDEDIYDKMLEVAKESKYNGDDVEEKFKTFRMIRNVIQHFPIFESWDEIYVSNSLLEWNNKGKDKQIKTYFNKERELSYIIFLKEDDEWVAKVTINIKTPKLGKYNKIYLKDLMTIDEAIWTFSIIDYYLQIIGLNIEPRYIVSA